MNHVVNAQLEQSEVAGDWLMNENPNMAERLPVVPPATKPPPSWRRCRPSGHLRVGGASPSHHLAPDDGVVNARNRHVRSRVVREPP